VTGLGIQTPNPVLSVWLQTEGTFCFVEFRSVADCTACMTLLQGITIGGRTLRVGRPADYKPPPPALENYVVGYPPAAWGSLAAQSSTALSSAQTVTQTVTQTLTIPTLPEVGIIQNINPARLAQIREQGITSGSGATGRTTTTQPFPLVQSPVQGVTSSTPTRVLVLRNMISERELIDDDEFVDIVLDVRDECEKFGAVKKIVIPRPKKDGKQGFDSGKLNGIGDDRGPRLGGSAVGKIFVQFKDVEAAKKARGVLNLRMFNNNKVDATFFLEDEFYKDNFG